MPSSRHWGCASATCPSREHASLQRCREMGATLPSVFIVQGVPEEALTDLRHVATVEMFDRTDRPINRTELLDAVRRCDYLWAFGEIAVDTEIIDAAQLRMIAIMEIVSRAVDIAEATRRGIP